MIFVAPVQNNPVVPIPMAHDGKGEFVECLKNGCIRFGCPCDKTQAFSTAFEAKQCCAVGHRANGLAYLAKTQLTPMLRADGGDTGCTTILFAELADAGKFLTTPPSQ